MPSTSGSSSLRANSAPVMSVKWKVGAAFLPAMRSQPARTPAAASPNANLRRDAITEQRPQVVVDQQRGEEQRQVDDREAEGLPRQRVGVAAPEPPAVAAEHDAEDDRRGEVDRPAHSGDEGQQGRGEQHQRVQEDVQARELRAVRHRQHRQAGAAVVLGAVERERPEVRRRPQEDDQAEDQRLGADVAADRRPAEHRRHRPRRAADDDVLRRQRLEQHRVDDGIADERGERQPHRQRVDREPEDRAARAAERGRERERLAGRQLAGGRGAPRRARHAGVDALLDQAVERRRRGGDEPDARDRRRERGASRAAPASPAACRSGRRRRSAGRRAASSARSTGAASPPARRCARAAGARVSDIIESIL